MANPANGGVFYYLPAKLGSKMSGLLELDPTVFKSGLISRRTFSGGAILSSFFGGKELFRPLEQKTYEPIDLGVERKSQERNLSCEVAVAAMVGKCGGAITSERKVLERIRYDQNPHWGFRGDLDGPVADPTFENYGLYAEEMVRLLKKDGIHAWTEYKADYERVRDHLQERRLAIVWMSWFSRNEITVREERDVGRGENILLVRGEHVWALSGLDRNGRYLVNDPWPDICQPFYASWIPNWDLFNGMRVVVPKDQDFRQERQEPTGYSVPRR